MRNRTYWVDHVLSETNKFSVVETGSANVYTITPYGTIMQEGTYQDANHFNSIEEGLTAHEAIIELLINYARQNKWDVDDFKTENSAAHTALNALITALDQFVSKLHTMETGSVTLANNLKFPFNNSKTTKALATAHDNTNYVVVVEVAAFSGNVGEVIVSEQLVNGFKIEYTGSASSVTINYKIIGGWNK